VLWKLTSAKSVSWTWFLKQWRKFKGNSGSWTRVFCSTEIWLSRTFKLHLGIPCTVSQINDLKFAFPEFVTPTSCACCLQFSRFVAAYPPKNQAEADAYNRADLTMRQNLDFATANGQGLLDWLDAHSSAANRRPMQTQLPVSPTVYWDWLSPAMEWSDKPSDSLASNKRRVAYFMSGNSLSI